MGKEPACKCRRCRRLKFDPWSEKSPEGGHDNPLQYSCLQNRIDKEAWWVIVHRVTKSRTQLKRLSKYFLQSSLLLFHCSVVSDPMGCSTPGCPVFHHLQELAQTHVHCVGDASCRKEINYMKSIFRIKR